MQETAQEQDPDEVLLPPSLASDEIDWDSLDRLLWDDQLLNYDFDPAPEQTFTVGPEQTSTETELVVVNTKNPDVEPGQAMASIAYSSSLQTDSQGNGTQGIGDEASSTGPEYPTTELLCQSPSLQEWFDNLSAAPEHDYQHGLIINQYPNAPPVGSWITPYQHMETGTELGGLTVSDTLGGGWDSHAQCHTGSKKARSSASQDRSNNESRVHSQLDIGFLTPWESLSREGDHSCSDHFEMVEHTSQAFTAGLDSISQIGVSVSPTHADTTNLLAPAGLNHTSPFPLGSPKPAATSEPLVTPIPAVLKPRRSAQRVRGKLTEEQKQKAKTMRKIGNCLRCKLYKLGCDPNTPCQECRKTQNNARTYLEPCYRDNLDRVSLARHGNNNFGQREVSFVEYFWVEKDLPCKNLQLRWSLPGGKPVELPFMNIACKEFIPKNNDTHFISWQVHGQVMSLELPPFAGSNTAALKASVSNFLEVSRPKVLQYILAGLTDEVAIRTLREASRFNEKYKSTVIDLALSIRCASFCSQGWGSITGPETLGIGEYDFNVFGECGYAAYDRGSDRPLPLSIDHQLDVAILLTIKGYQKRLVKELHHKIFQKGEKPWFELFLAVYILLSNLEYVHGGSYSFLQSQIQTKSERSVSYLTREMIEEYNYSANNLLHHFRCILRGPVPFKIAERSLDELQQRARLDDDSTQYMRHIVDLLQRKRTLSQQSEVVLAGDQLGPPDGRWLSRLFEGLHM